MGLSIRGVPLYKPLWLVVSPLTTLTSGIISACLDQLWTLRSVNTVGCWVMRLALSIITLWSPRKNPGKPTIYSWFTWWTSLGDQPLPAMLLRSIRRPGPPYNDRKNGFRTNKLNLKITTNSFIRIMVYYSMVNYGLLFYGQLWFTILWSIMVKTILWSIIFHGYYSMVNHGV